MIMSRLAGWSLLLPAMLVLVVDLYRTATLRRVDLLSLADTLNALSRRIDNLLEAILPDIIWRNLIEPLLDLPAGLTLLSLSLFLFITAARAATKLEKQKRREQEERVFLH